MSTRSLERSSRPGARQRKASLLGQYFKKPGEIGAIAPSSKHLAKAMCSGVNLHKAAVVVEYGPGTGSFTGAIQRHVGPATRFFAIEINPELVKTLRRRFPGVSVHEGSVADVERFCRIEGVSPPSGPRGAGSIGGADGGVLPAAGGFGSTAELVRDAIECDRRGVDVVISGLPWAVFPAPLQRQIMEATVRVLNPGGVFVTFGYALGNLLPAGRRFAKLLPDYFSRVERSKPILRNLPPAFIYRCWK